MSNNHNCGGNSSSKISCLVGPNGRKGQTGPRGVQGPQGEQGLKGDQGAAGADGPVLDNYGYIYTAFGNTENPYYASVIASTTYYPVFLDTITVIDTEARNSITHTSGSANVSLLSGYYLVYYSLTVAGVTGDNGTVQAVYHFAIVTTTGIVTTLANGSEQGEYITQATVAANIAGAVIIQVPTTATLNLVLVNPADQSPATINDNLPIEAVTVTIIRLGDYVI